MVVLFLFPPSCFLIYNFLDSFVMLCSFRFTEAVGKGLDVKGKSAKVSIINDLYLGRPYAE